jgi:hypothetical protein
VIPTVIAQIWFQPREVSLETEREFIYLGTADHFLHTPEE